LLAARKVSKKFCRDLRRALHYGLLDIGNELLGKSNKHDDLRRDEFWAVKDVSFEMKPGDSVAILGRNGAGKSTLLRMITGKLRLDQGEIRVRGRMAAINELGAGFNHLQTGRENVYNAASLYGLTREQTDEIYEKIVDFAEVRNFMDSPVANFSSGMKARLGYAVTAHLQPDLFVMDEVLAVGDILFRKKCLDHLKNYREKGRTILMATHDLFRIQSICNRCLVMEAGKIAFDGDVAEGINYFLDLLVSGRDDEISRAIVSELKSQVMERDILLKEVKVKKKTRPKVVIKSLQLSPCVGDVINRGDQVQVQMDYVVSKEIREATWVFSIYLADKPQYVAGGFSAFDGIRYLLNKGRGQLKCTISNFHLKPGKYCVRGLLIGRNGLHLAKFDSNSEASSFSVMGTAVAAEEASGNPEESSNILKIKWQ